MLQKKNFKYLPLTLLLTTIFIANMLLMPISASAQSINSGRESSLTNSDKDNFNDVSINSCAYIDIIFLKNKGIINGVGKGNFAPENNITRAQFAVILARSLNLKINYPNNTFGDITEAWMKSGILTPAGAEIMFGRDDGKFHPYDGILREELLVILRNTIEYIKENKLKVKTFRNLNNPDLIEEFKGMQLDSFKDWENLNPSCMKEAEICIKYGLIKGDNKKLLLPLQYTTRAEAAMVIARLLKYFAIS